MMIATFNDPNANVDVMLLSLSFNVTGMNLQRACHHGICTMYYFNPSQMKQAMARINRIGQRNVVYWTVIKQLGSYAELQELVIARKDWSFLSAGGLIPKFIGEDLRMVAGYEITRETWGTLESKYVLTKHACEFDSVQQWSADWVRRYAKYYSMLASLVLQGLAEVGLAELDETQEKQDALLDKLRELQDDFGLVVLV